jgi:HK97 family phage portal protein
LRTTVAATLPMQIKRRVDDRTRTDATDAPMWGVLNRRPNKWQKPAQFKRMMQAHVMLRGNAYAHKVRDFRGRVVGLIPLHPDRVAAKQLDDLSMQYIWTRKDGRQVPFTQDEILHMFALTLDGVCGVTPLTYARETIGAGIAMTKHGGAMFRNGATMSGALKHPKTLTPEAHGRLTAGMQDFRSGGARDGETIILEEGMDYIRLGLSAEDAQWIQSRGFGVVEVCMLYGVQPHMIGYTEGNTKLGSSIEQQTQGAVTFGFEDDFVMWEEAVNVDCLHETLEADLYMRINRNALVRGDMKTRWGAYVQALQWGVFSPNHVLELEDENPREGGDVYYDPPNTAGGQADPFGGGDPNKETNNA